MKLKLRLTQTLLLTTLIVLTTTTLVLYQSSFIHTYANTSIPSDVSNSGWMLSIILVIGIFGGVVLKTDHINSK